MGGEEKPSFLENARTNWNGFRHFLWNAEKKEFLGRNGKSWGQIGIFYLVFYICLAAFWALMLFIFLQTVSPDYPTFNSLVGVPGLTLQPKFQSKLVEYNPDKPPNYSKQVERLQSIWDSFDPIKQSGPEYVDCGIEGPPEGKFCRFDRETLGPCRPPNFGWDEGMPCFYVSLNRVSKWVPENYEGDDIPDEVEDIYEPDNVAIFCKNYKDNHPDYSNNTMYPASGIPFYFYPFVGTTDVNKRAAYIQPYVAVMFQINAVGKKVKLQCQTFVANISPQGGLFDTDYESIVTYELIIPEE